MKKIGIIIFAAALVLGVVLANAFSFGRVGYKFLNVSVNFGGVEGSGKVATEQRSVSDFSKVDVGGVFQVEIVAGKDYSVEVQADDNLLPLIRTEVRGDTLQISSEKRFNTRNDIKVRITAPNIEGIETSGASKVNASAIKSEALAIDTSGASKVSLAGETRQLNIQVSGASNIDASNLNAVDADVDASGASKVSIIATGNLKTEASGASSITYSGNPANVEKHTSGASRVNQR